MLTLYKQNQTVSFGGTNLPAATSCRRRIDLMQMPGVATIGSHSHVGSQAMVKSPLPWWLCSLAAVPRWFAGQLSTHQSSWASTGVYGTFASWRPRRERQADSNLESLESGTLTVLNDLVHFQPVLHNARTLINGGLSIWVETA